MKERTTREVGDVTATAVIERLTTEECWGLLQATDLGRLAVVREDGSPDLFPVNYRAHEGSVYVRTARDSKLAHLARRPVAAFEIDGDTDSAHWSVVVKGPVERVTDEREIRDSGVGSLTPSNPTPKRYVVKVSARSITGRRFLKGGGVPSAIVAFEDTTPPEDDGRRRPVPRAERPNRIPHTPPKQ